MSLIDKWSRNVRNNHYAISNLERARRIQDAEDNLANLQRQYAALPLLIAQAQVELLNQQRTRVR